MQAKDTSPQRKGVRASRGSEILGCGESTYWRYTKEADFPKPMKLSARMTIWDEGELLAWRESRRVGATA